MTEATRALYQFYTGFELPVYVEGYVPDTAELPYITFDSVDSGLSRQASHHVRVWYPGMENSLPAEKADEIAAAIGDGVRLITEHGLVVIYPDTPLIQIQAVDSEADRHICYAYINLATMTYIKE